MRERPILMSAPMVRACLREIDPKTQTRRAVKGISQACGGQDCIKDVDGLPSALPGPRNWELCPYGVPGDLLWVKETTIRTPAGTAYAADGGEHFGAGGRLRKTPAIHCRRTDSRITLEITDVRVERLQDISEADAIAEGLSVAPGGWWSGFDGSAAPTPQAAYALLWEHINGPNSWDANPFVWCVSFERVTV